MKIELTQQDLVILSMAYDRQAKQLRANSEFMKGYELADNMSKWAEDFESLAKHFEEIGEKLFKSNTEA